MNTLVLWEFSRKQNYIFNSNKLVECVGASLIIRDLTENFNEYKLKEDNFIIRGGGKTLYLFETEKESEEFIRDYSLNVIKDYPGLELFMVKQNFDIKRDSIKEVINQIYRKLEEKKGSRLYAGNQIGFGIERECTSTKYPAAGYYEEDNEKRYISSEVIVKRKIGKENDKDFFDNLIPKGYVFSKKMDDLVKDSSKSYVAVVHIDGNGMGKKIKNLGKAVNKGIDESEENFNRKYIRILRGFSSEINEKYSNAFKDMCTSVAEKNQDNLKDCTKLEENIIPIRPLIMAGDDVTYISNGYIGIETARLFIENLNKYHITIEGIDLGKLHACAGIAIVKKGYPFIEAYDLSEDLCQNAKRMLLDRNYEDESSIDFHITQGNLNKSIYEIREEDYKINSDNINLTMRPLVLNNSKDWRNYNNFLESFENIKKSIDEDKIGRGKIKELREVLTKGIEETKYFFKFYKINCEKYFKSLEATGEYCFNMRDNTCMYLDAIEVMDLFIKLN